MLDKFKERVAVKTEPAPAAIEPTEGELVAVAERDRMLVVVDVAYAKAAAHTNTVKAKQAFYQSLKDQIWNDIVAP